MTSRELFTVLYTKGHITKSMSMNLNLVSNLKLKCASYNMIPKYNFTKNVICSFFCWSASQILISDHSELSVQDVTHANNPRSHAT